MNENALLRGVLVVVGGGGGGGVVGGVREGESRVH